VPLHNFIARFLRQRFEFLYVRLHGVRKIAIFEWQQVRISKTHNRYSCRLRESSAVHKIRVAKMSEPVKIIINRMIDAAAVFPAKSEIQRGNAIVLQKSSIIRTRTERPDPQVGSRTCF